MLRHGTARWLVREAHAGAALRLVSALSPSAPGPPSSEPPQSSPPLRHFQTDTAIHATTVVCVRKEGHVVVMGDGQVTMGSQIMKPNVRKVRRLGEKKDVIAGFAGTAADGFTLFERLEARIDEFPGQLTRAAVELAKSWRTDKFLRKLDAVLVVADEKVSLMVSGTGDVLEPQGGVLGIGSGGPYALAAARALVDIPGLDAEHIARKAMGIAADCCIYTNTNFTMEELKYETKTEAPPEEPSAQVVDEMSC